ncbi:hypothetical protein J2J97_32200 (plasmid) [Rhizobium bangladeshense]|uniref:hypothetical protein n=1 Tax=Rhizobium bangladeshense TaxID=1138189 RepID=UPI001A988B07|nr:hypothetical protein [Rhizobium bangladeshense]QSY98568.1 hypothetical protein J2J97_32200 [Rhizobium bangladeshense]
MSKYAKLDDICKRLGYHGICPEALEELLNIQPMIADFMAGMRQMLGPPEIVRHRSVPVEHNTIEMLTLVTEEELPCPVCGNEERGQGGYLTCECPGKP